MLRNASSLVAPPVAGGCWDGDGTAGAGCAVRSRGSRPLVRGSTGLAAAVSVDVDGGVALASNALKLLISIQRYRPINSLCRLLLKRLGHQVELLLRQPLHSRIVLVHARRDLLKEDNEFLVHACSRIADKT